MRICAMLLAIAAASFGQSARPAFEVASVKRHEPPVTSVTSKVSGPRATWTAYPMMALLMEAYGMAEYQIIGGPSWLNSDFYDIEAKAAGNDQLTKDQAAQMLRGLLEERFHLTVHRESREMQVYSLVVVKNGPKFRPSGPDAKFGVSFRSRGVAMEMTATKWTMDRLARQLSSDQGYKVTNMTGLGGDYDFTLTYADERHIAAADADAPSIFGALQEQLGLKLETQKQAVETLVIDHADRPSQN